MSVTSLVPSNQRHYSQAELQQMAFEGLAVQTPVTLRLISATINRAVGLVALPGWIYISGKFDQAIAGIDFEFHVLRGVDGMMVVATSDPERAKALIEAAR